MSTVSRTTSSPAMLANRTLARVMAALSGTVLFATAMASPVPGSYLRVEKYPNYSGVLRIFSVSASEATLSLDLTYTPLSGTPRTGELDKAAVPIEGNVALYESSQDDGPRCFLVFVFSASKVRVAQFGECPLFGVGVEASGEYVRAWSKAKK